MEQSEQVNEQAETRDPVWKQGHPADRLRTLVDTLRDFATKEQMWEAVQALRAIVHRATGE